MEGVRRRGRDRRSSRRAQATLEFAFSAPLLLLCLFGAVDAAAWSVQQGAAVAALEQGTRIAASAPAEPTSTATPTAAEVTAAVVSHLRPAMFATGVRPWCGSGARCGTRPCPPSPAAVQSAFGPRVVAVCVEEHAAPPCVTDPTPGSLGVPPYCGESPTVTVRAVGYMASLVPPGFGLGWQSGEIPLDVGATTHALTFAP
jgi:hypothetical protein